MAVEGEEGIGVEFQLSGWSHTRRMRLLLVILSAGIYGASAVPCSAGLGNFRGVGWKAVAALTGFIVETGRQMCKYTLQATEPTGTH